MNHWIEVSEERLRWNFSVLQRAAGMGTSLLAVVKANAYGHGAEVVAPVLARAGAEWLGVTDAAEGAVVRAALTAAGIEVDAQPRILVMSGLCHEEAAAIVRHELTAVAWSVEQLRWLGAVAEKYGRVAQVHVEVDTGMSRQGARVGAELAAVLRAIAADERLALDGVFTHFASAEVSRSKQTVEQQVVFEDAMRQVNIAGLRPEWVHAGNSSLVDEGLLLDWVRRQATVAGAQAMVRPGIALYGYCLPLEAWVPAGFHGASEEPAPISYVRGELLPVMSWKARVIGLRELEAGDRVGYNGTFVAKQAMRVALLPVGYADGLRRELSGTGWVMMEGRRAGILGRVSMNLTVVDVTGIAGVELGSVAVVLGNGVTAEHHAVLAKTLPYEILCGVRAEIRLVE